MLEIKNTVTEMKNDFHRLTTRLGMTEERSSKLKVISIETTKTGKKREHDIQGLWENYKRYKYL
jgi:hypothetical protein